MCGLVLWFASVTVDRGRVRKLSAVREKISC
jgi:hypothetical protein